MCLFFFKKLTSLIFYFSAQPGGSLSQLTSNRKRKLTEYSSCNTNAASTLPPEKRDREDLAWSTCMLGIAARQLALLNKTGQVDFEINIVCRTFSEWMRNMVSMFFSSFFGGALFLSYDRVIAGFITRQIATTFLTTCARHICTTDNLTDANTRTLLDMECAPLTLQSCNLAIANALTHLVDTNLLMVNQLIRDKLNTPILPPSFLVDILGTTPVGLGMPHFDQVFGWLGQMMQYRQNNGEIEFNSGYVSIAKFGTAQDYATKEGYLESYYGMTKNNVFTYTTAIRECASKVFDLSGFINMEDGCGMTDFGRFVSRIGVGHDSNAPDKNGQPAAPAAPPPPPQPIHPAFETYRNTYVFTQNAGDHNSAIGNTAPNAPAGGQPPQGGNRPSIGRTWVSLIQHLLVTSLQGECELHADNMFTFGANLTEFILNRCAPTQTTPAQAMVYESFRHIDNDVVPLRLRTGFRPQYFVRSINDTSAINLGIGSELPALLGAHPIEDVMHLGGWIQLATILNNGTKPSSFYTLPTYNGRPPELVRGRNYPLLGLPGSGVRGSVCLCPDNRMCARIVVFTPEDERVAAPEAMDEDEDSGPWKVYMPKIEEWYQTLEKLKVMVAPLVFRRFAVFSDSSIRDRLFVSSTENVMDPPRDYDEALHPVLHHGMDEEDRVELGVMEEEQYQQRIDEQFLDHQGYYTLLHSEEVFHRVTFEEAHSRLLEIGTFIVVEVDALRAFGFNCNRRFVRASIRYPDEGEIANNIFDSSGVYNIFFAVKTRERNNSGNIRIRILHAKASSCMLLDSDEARRCAADTCTEIFAVAMAGVMGVEQQQAPQEAEME